MTMVAILAEPVQTTFPMLFSCQLAGIDAPPTITRFFGEKVEEVTLPKYWLIATHTARKTFLTNSILLGMNYMAAHGISGHKRDKNFNRYVKIA